MDFTSSPKYDYNSDMTPTVKLERVTLSWNNSKEDEQTIPQDVSLSLTKVSV